MALGSRLNWNNFAFILHFTIESIKEKRYWPLPGVIVLAAGQSGDGGEGSGVLSEPVVEGSGSEEPQLARQRAIATAAVADEDEYEYYYVYENDDSGFGLARSRGKKTKKSM